MDELADVLHGRRGIYNLSFRNPCCPGWPQATIIYFLGVTADTVIITIDWVLYSCIYTRYWICIPSAGQTSRFAVDGRL